MQRRRAAALVITPLLAALALAGCGSSSSSSSAAAASSASASSTAAASASATAAASGAASASAAASAPVATGPGDYTSVTAAGTFGKAPTVTIPAKAGTGTLYTKTVIQGAGAPLTSAQSLLGNFVLYDWSGTTHKLIGSTFTQNVPTLFAGTLLPGLAKALIGQKVGSRVLAVIPPADAFGSTGNSSIGVGATDTIVFVVDMVKAFANTADVPGKQTYSGGGTLPTVTAGAVGKAPTITIPKSAAPKTLVVKDLIKGTGATVKKGQFIVVQYTGVNWRTGKVFDSSYSRSEVWGTVIGEKQVITGWDTGLVGQKVGSRVLLVIPPADGYGTAGSASAGIKGTDDLVFVIDIISAS